MNLNLVTHHHRLARVGLGYKISKKLCNFLSKKINCQNHIKNNNHTTLYSC